MSKEFLKELKEKRQDYKSMIDFCCDSLILNNSIISELERNGYFFDIYTGDFYIYFDRDGNELTRQQYERKQEDGEEVSENYTEVYQYFLISEADAERLAEYTNELVLYNEKLELYLLCVTHYGTYWGGVSANWKNCEEGA